MLYEETGHRRLSAPVAQGHPVDRRHTACGAGPPPPRRCRCATAPHATLARARARRPPQTATRRDSSAQRRAARPLNRRRSARRRSERGRSRRDRPTRAASAPAVGKAGPRSSGGRSTARKSSVQTGSSRSQPAARSRPGRSPSPQEALCRRSLPPPRNLAPSCSAPSWRRAAESAAACSGHPRYLQRVAHRRAGGKGLIASAARAQRPRLAIFSILLEAETEMKPT